MIINEEVYAVGVGIMFAIFGVYVIVKNNRDADDDDNSISDPLLTPPENNMKMQMVSYNSWSILEIVQSGTKTDRCKRYLI
jgi:hypothetical protein